jgi:hypothetical protein
MVQSSLDDQANHHHAASCPTRLVSLADHSWNGTYSIHSLRRTRDMENQADLSGST